MNRLPSVFVSHGAPSFAIEPGLAGPQLTALGRELPTPHAVLIVSPHWMTPSPQVGMVERPRTIHDFGGFAPALYEIDYPVHGHPQLARRTLDLLQEAGWSPRPDERRGLDHGAWVPMLYLYPEADVPVFQVSLPARLDADSAWAFGQALAPLADDGVLIVGSGSLTHNLYDFRGGYGHDGHHDHEAYADRVRRLGSRRRRQRRQHAAAPDPVLGTACRARTRPPNISGHCWWPPARRPRRYRRR
jgi:4,5-DOPA dioxygenase extradiol